MEKEMWDAYAKQAGGVTFDGKPLPTWDELGKERQACWKAAAATLLRVLEQVHNDIELAVMSDDEYCRTIENDNKRLQKENELLQKELKKHLTYQDHRHGRIGTHDPICYEYGPRHYECALREIERLRARLQDIANFSLHGDYSNAYVMPEIALRALAGEVTRND